MAAASMHAVLLAFGLILPLGVQNVFVFNQGALHRRYREALPIILTASVCDTLLIGAAVGGVSVLLLASPWAARLLMAGGTVFLLYMGTVVWRSRPSEEKEEGTAFPARKQISFGLFVSLLNPHAILDTVGVIGTSSLAYTGWSKVAFGLSCAAVSWVWFFSLAGAGRIIGALDRSGSLMGMLNRASALVMWAAAVWMGGKLFYGA